MAQVKFPNVPSFDAFTGGKLKMKESRPKGSRVVSVGKDSSIVLSGGMTDVGADTESDPLEGLGD